MNEFFTKSDLKQRRYWSTRLINSLLGQSDSYSRDKVFEAEKSKAFLTFQELRIEFIKERKRIIVNNKKIILSHVEERPIKITRLSIDELHNVALEAWMIKNKNKMTWDNVLMHVKNIQLELNKKSIEYLRQQQFRKYWTHLKEDLNLKHGMTVEQEFLKDIILDAIAKVYPELDELCNAQCLEARKRIQIEKRMENHT